MFSTCLFCHSRLGKNEVVEHFPVGSRLAFDSARGRLWAVCPECRRWNLSPLDDRWEAIDECERLFRSTRARVSTENIGLAPLVRGVDLIRDRPAPSTRIRRVALWIAAEVAATSRWIAAGVAGAAGLAAMAVAAPPLLAPLPRSPAFLGARRERAAVGRAGHDRDGHQGPLAVGARCAPVAGSQGRPLTVRVRHLWESAYYTDRKTDELGATPRARWRRHAVRGDPALSAGGRLLARANWLGGAGRIVQRAVARSTRVGNADGFLHKTASRFSRFHGKRMMARLPSGRRDEPHARWSGSRSRWPSTRRRNAARSRASSPPRRGVEGGGGDSGHRGRHVRRAERR